MSDRHTGLSPRTVTARQAHVTGTVRRPCPRSLHNLPRARHRAARSFCNFCEGQSGTQAFTPQPTTKDQVTSQAHSLDSPGSALLLPRNSTLKEKASSVQMRMLFRHFAGVFAVAGCTQPTAASPWLAATEVAHSQVRIQHWPFIRQHTPAVAVVVMGRRWSRCAFLFPHGGLLSGSWRPPWQRQSAGANWSVAAPALETGA